MPNVDKEIEKILGASNKMVFLDKVEILGFQTCAELRGNPSMGKYIEQCDIIIIFYAKN